MSTKDEHIPVNTPPDCSPTSIPQRDLMRIWIGNSYER
jgi:hypothetical protein